MKINVTLSDRELADLLCSALEGGSNYWIECVTVYKGKEDGNPWGDEYTPSYMRAVFSTNGRLEIATEDGVKILERAGLIRGLEVLADKYPHHISSIINESTDASTGDALLQCALFRDIIYG